MTSTLTRTPPASVPAQTGTTLDELEDMIATPGVYVVMITPETAQRLLDRNTKNRGKKPRSIELYRRDMEAGKWRLTNQGIGFDVNGVLSDGQNRLAACVLAKVPFRTLLVTGLDPDARDVTDTGAKRLFGDVLRMNGYTNVLQLAGAVGLRHRYETLVREKRPYTQAGIVSLRPTHEELLEFMNSRPTIEAMATGCHTYTAEFPSLPASSAIVFESLAVEQNADKLQEFRQALITGANLSLGDPRLVLRNFLARSQPVRRGGPSSMYFLGIMVKAWNDWMNGFTRQQLTLRDVEAMPKIGAKPTWERRKRQEMADAAAGRTPAKD